MSDPSLRAVVRRWLRFAHEDLLAAEALATSKDGAPRLVCWLAQQAAEKALKAVLVFLQVEFPFTHNLDTLRNVLPAGWRLKEEHPDLRSLTAWAIAGRYPGDWPDATAEDAREAVQQARSVWESVVRDLERHGYAMTEEP